MFALIFVIYALTLVLISQTLLWPIEIISRCDSIIISTGKFPFKSNESKYYRNLTEHLLLLWPVYTSISRVHETLLKNDLN